MSIISLISRWFPLFYRWKGEKYDMKRTVPVGIIRTFINSLMTSKNIQIMQNTFLKLFHLIKFIRFIWLLMEGVYIARVQSTLTGDGPTIPESFLWASLKWFVQFKKCLFIRTPPNMTNFYLKNSSRIWIWLNVYKLCHVDIFHSVEVFRICRWRMQSPIEYVVWFQYPVVIQTYIRTLLFASKGMIRY